MNDNNRQLAGAISQQTGKLTPLGIQGMLEKWKSQHFPKLMALASSKEEAERLYVVCMNTLSKSPKLLECTFDSIATCILTSFQLKLYPGPMSECAYIPFGNTATFVPQYQGLIKLCYNSGFIKSIRVKVVYEGEKFEYVEGMNPVLEHVPDLDIDHAKVQRKCVYCVIKTRYDDVQMTVLSPRFIQGIKARSKGAKKPDSPWNGNPDDVDAMWAKTAIKQALKLIPKSSELAEAVAVDDSIDAEFEKGKVVDLALTVPMQPTQEEPKSITHEEREAIEIPVEREPELTPLQKAKIRADKEREGA